MPPTSTPSRHRSDRMKDTILKESSAGWGTSNINNTPGSNAITPLRIAKRDTLSPSSSSSPSSYSGPSLPGGATQVVARRSSNSYKHMFNSNLVSRSPFKSQLAPRQPLGAANTPRIVVTPRKTSGEKRPRPDSLVHQAEQENSRRIQELGYKRRQSRGYQTLTELEHVSKSPFKKDGSPEKREFIDPVEPIAIAFPTKHDDETTSPETTETESSLNSKERPLSPPSIHVEYHYSNSPTFVERRSPGPSALQGSPARSSLAQKPRLQGPRSRSLSIGAPKSPDDPPPVRERRRTVTFDERCDVVEFDRESHEGSVFESDDEDGFYGHGRSNSDIRNDDSLDSYDSNADETVQVAKVHDVDEDMFDAQILNDSINGLVDSMLQEAHSMSGPSTPEGNHSFQSIAEDGDMVTGGAERGIPLGRTHHAERLQSHMQEFRDEETIPALFDELAKNQSSSPPRKPETSFEEPHTPQTRHRRSSSFVTRPILPPDTECVEDGIPLGRTHHSERIRDAHDGPQDDDVDMLPPSPSPVKSTPQLSHSRDLAAPMIPKLDFGINPSNSPHSRSDNSFTGEDVFGGDEIDANTGAEDDDHDEVLMLPPTPVEVDRMPARPSLEERLKRVMSPTLSAPSPLRTSTSPTPGLRELSRSPTVDTVSPRLGLRETSNSPALHAITPLPGHQQGPSQSPVVHSPPRPIHHQRAYTYDFDERARSEEGSGSEDGSESESDGAPEPLQAPIAQAARSPVSANFDFAKHGVDIAEMDMRSALDRLVDDVSIAGGVEPSQADHSLDPLRDQSMTSTAEGEVSMGEMTADGHGLLSSLTDAAGDSRSPVRGNEPSLVHSSSMPTLPGPSAMQRQSSTEEEEDDSEDAISEDEQPPSPTPKIDVAPRHEFSSRPPPVPPKTPEKPQMSARQAREEMIREKRREARARESGEYFVPPRRDAAGNLMEESPASKRKSGNRPSGRRSMSMGDVNETLEVAETPVDTRRRISELKKQKGGVLGMMLQDEDFQSSVERELKRNDKNGKKKTYEVVEHSAVYASSSQGSSIAQLHEAMEKKEQIWKAVKRPSDINDYARQIRELRAREKQSKAQGRVYVKVVQIRSLHLPLPQQTTLFTCTLYNGQHFVTTPECRLSRDAYIGQEFELIEKGNLEFTLSLKVKRDPHIVQQFKAIAIPPPPSPAAPAPASSHRGVFSFFGSPKKPKPGRLIAPPPPIHHPVENLARYMKPDGTLARTFVAFKEIEPYCNGCLFQTVFPLTGQRLEAPGEGGGSGGTLVPKQVGELTLEVFRLPPIPGIPEDKLPQSSDECHLGLINASWHKKTYFEGILTQNGGDCSTWRRRKLSVIGGKLVAYSDVTKKASSVIDLKLAHRIEDDQDPVVLARRRDIDGYDATYGVERSFRVLFTDDQEIQFFADTDAEKAEWLWVLRQIVGNIPETALWAEILFQKLSVSTKSSLAVEADKHPATPRRRR